MRATGREIAAGLNMTTVGTANGTEIMTVGGKKAGTKAGTEIMTMDETTINDAWLSDPPPSFYRFFFRGSSGG